MELLLEYGGYRASRNCRRCWFLLNSGSHFSFFFASHQRASLLPHELTPSKKSLETIPAGYAYLNIMPPVLDTLSTILSDPDLIASSGRYDAATEFKRTQAGFYDCFDKLMAASKSLIAAYHSMLEMHKDCARMINQLLALGQPNSVVGQHIRARKAQIEQDMLEMESIQCETMRSIQLLHDGSKWIAWGPIEVV